MTKSQSSQVSSRDLKLAAGGFAQAAPHHASDHVDDNQIDQDQSPPMSPLRLPQLSSSSSSIASWSSSQTSQLSEFSDLGECNSKEDRSSYNTKFARYHLESYRQNDRMRWNFDFEHNRPLDDSHHHPHHHPTVGHGRYQWEPAV